MVKNTIIHTYQRHKLAVIGVLFAIAAALAYVNPQAFLNLWLTRDQQGILLLKQQNPAQAALTFNNREWVAYSFYASCDFEQAARLFAEFEGRQAQFFHANALAHIGQYFKAADLYQQLLTAKVDNTSSRAGYPSAVELEENLALMDKIIKKLKKSPGKKTLTDEVDPNLQRINTDKQPAEKKRIQSSTLWLEQVQQNPSKFLRKKFQQEHQNESK